MKIISQVISNDDLKIIAQEVFGDMVKGVVDVEQGILALSAELHADLESFLLEQGSKQKDLWGINLYPDASDEDFVEFDSMINIRPSQNNRSRSVEDKALQKKIIQIVSQKIKR